MNLFLLAQADPAIQQAANVATERLGMLDMSIIVAYMIGITTIGILSVRRQKLTGDMYFLAGRSLKWPVIGAALFASNISTIHLVGLAEAGFSKGFVVGNFEWMATFTLILLALIFAPFYFRSKISTMPEFLEKRYGRLARTFMAVMAIAAALMIHIGISLYAGAEVFEQFFGIPVLASIVIISVITAIYTVVGGLKAVVVTETIQTVILLGGAIIVTYLALSAVADQGITTVEEFKLALQPDQMKMIQTGRPDGWNWYAFLLGYPILGVWYWCSDQTIVQRVLGAKDLEHAQRGALFAGFLKFLPVFLMVLPGLACYILFKDQLVEVTENGQKVIKPLLDAPIKALPVMLVKLVPPGLRGLIAAGLLAALMSSIAAALNSTGTLVARDIVLHFRPATSDQAQVRIGRISAVVVMLLAMAWSTQGYRFGSIFDAVNRMPAQFLAPPIATVFVWGVFWKRGTKQAALATLFIGFFFGLAEFIVDLPLITIYTKEVIVNGVATQVPARLIEDILGIGFMMQAWWNFCICSGIFVIVSLLTPAPSPEQVENTTWSNPLQVIFHSKLVGYKDPRMIAAGLLVMLVIMYSVITYLASN